MGCRTARKSILIVKDKDLDEKDKLIWKWIRGDPTSQQDFEDPTGSAQFSLCLYAGTAATLVAEAVVPPDPAKWRPTGTKGYKYKDKSGTHSGIQKIVLKGSDENKAKVILKGKGVNVPMDLPSRPRPQARWSCSTTPRLGAMRASLDSRSPEPRWSS